MAETIDREAIANWLGIRLLVDKPGSSVVITAPGLDYTLEPCASVICRGIWTGDEGITFTGADHLEALSKAVVAYTAASR